MSIRTRRGCATIRVGRILAGAGTSERERVAFFEASTERLERASSCARQREAEVKLCRRPKSSSGRGGSARLPVRAGGSVKGGGERTGVRYSTWTGTSWTRAGGKGCRLCRVRRDQGRRARRVPRRALFLFPSLASLSKQPTVMFSATRTAAVSPARLPSRPALPLRAFSACTRRGPRC